MLEFSAIAVSSYEAASLADRLNESAADGWSVVAIVPTGNTVTAYLSREAAPAAPAAITPAAITPAAITPAAITPAIVALEKTAFGPVDITPEPTAAEPTVAPAASAPAASTGGAPAGWYADPSGRFEMRYWDGGQWTEHVSRAGQQFTDPPVA